MKKGSTLTQEHRDKLRLAHLGKPSPKPDGFGARVSAGLKALNSSMTKDEYEKRYSTIRSGIPHSQETRKLQSEKTLKAYQNGRKTWNFIEDRDEAKRRRFFRGKCRNMVRRCVLAGFSKNKSTLQELGYSPEEFRLHIESKFLHGMSWENYGEWHIDHIKMISRFSLDTSISVVNALSNLRPLWKEDNLRRTYNE